MTIITIAHRLYTIQTADRIPFLEHGHLLAEGPHPVLYNKCRSYARLFDLQSSVSRRDGLMLSNHALSNAAEKADEQRLVE